jgi:hypothetical protein
LSGEAQAATRQVATRQSNMEPGTPPMALGEADRGLPVEGVLNPATSEASLSGEARRALPVEGVLNPNNCGMMYDDQCDYGC